MTARCRRGGRFAVAFAGLIALAPVSPASARRDAMHDCVEQGGTWYEDGRCEVAAESPAKACRRQGGQWAGGRRCVMQPTEQQRIDACKQAGGIVMQAGNCYGPARRR